MPAGEHKFQVVDGVREAVEKRIREQRVAKPTVGQHDG